MQTIHLAEFEHLASTTLPTEVERIPSMMSPKERKVLYGLARDHYTGAGVIMDAGVFCGASTMSFGAGIHDNPRFADIISAYEKPLRTFEYGIVNPGMISFFERHGVEGNMQTGDSFEPYLRKNIAPVADVVELSMGDICFATWANEPIEIMFLDVIKSRAIQNHLISTFYSSLLPGAILIQQDYFIEGLPFIKITQEALEPWFEYLGEVQSSAIYRLRAPIPASVLAEETERKLNDPHCLALLDQARDRSIDPIRRLMCDFGKVRFLADRDNAAARDLLFRLPTLYPAEFASKKWKRLDLALAAALESTGVRKAEFDAVLVELEVDPAVSDPGDESFDVETDTSEAATEFETAVASREDETVGAAPVAAPSIISRLSRKRGSRKRR